MIAKSSDRFFPEVPALGQIKKRPSVPKDSRLWTERSLSIVLLNQSTYRADRHFSLCNQFYSTIPQKTVLSKHLIRNTNSLSTFVTTLISLLLAARRGDIFVQIAVVIISRSANPVSINAGMGVTARIFVKPFLPPSKKGSGKAPLRPLAESPENRL